jgi:hypothetical protein
MRPDPLIRKLKEVWVTFPPLLLLLKSLSLETNNDFVEPIHKELLEGTTQGNLE